MCGRFSLSAICINRLSHFRFFPIWDRLNEIDHILTFTGTGRSTKINPNKKKTKLIIFSKVDVIERSIFNEYYSCNIGELFTDL